LNQAKKLSSLSSKVKCAGKKMELEKAVDNRVYDTNILKMIITDKQTDGKTDRQ